MHVLHVFKKWQTYTEWNIGFCGNYYNSLNCTSVPFFNLLVVLTGHIMHLSLMRYELSCLEISQNLCNTFQQSKSHCCPAKSIGLLKIRTTVKKGILKRAGMWAASYGISHILVPCEKVSYLCGCSTGMWLLSSKLIRKLKWLPQFCLELHRNNVTHFLFPVKKEKIS